MVSAPASHEVPPPPSSPHSTVETGEDTIESLRRAIEVQEAHVRLLRARRVARVSLLHRLHSLLATGDAVEAHTAVRHVVQQAEESLALLVQTEGAMADMAMDETATAGAAPFAPPSAEMDEMARVFHSGVVAQLAAVGLDGDASAAADDDDDGLRPPTTTQKGSRRRQEKEKKLARQQSAAVVHADPQWVVTPHRPATTVLLAQSASREAAGRAAMLTALESLHVALQGSGKESSNGGGAARGWTGAGGRPAWLQEEEVDAGGEAEDEGLEQPPPSAPLSSPRRSLSPTAAVTADYSDDFEPRSASTVSADAPEETLEPTREQRQQQQQESSPAES